MDINAINKIIKLNEKTINEKTINEKTINEKTINEKTINENKFKTKIPEAGRIRGVGVRVDIMEPIYICRRLLSKL